MRRDRWSLNIHVKIRCSHELTPRSARGTHGLAHGSPAKPFLPSGDTSATSRMGHHDFVVPIRFLALVGHFFSALLTLYAIKDNCIVALPFLYEQSDLDSLVGSASAALVLCFCVLAINAVSFFGGFSTFDLPISIFREFAKVPPQASAGAAAASRRPFPEPPPVARSRSRLTVPSRIVSLAQISSCTPWKAFCCRLWSLQRATTCTCGSSWASATGCSCSRRSTRSPP